MSMDQQLAADLGDIVGQAVLKAQLRMFSLSAAITKIRESRNLETPKKRPVMMFLGNPGTGKTSIATIVSSVLHRAGLVRTPMLTSVQREDLVGQHIGETGEKTLQVLSRANGGTLLVDEAYRLVPEDNSRDFGPEAVDALMSVMEGGSTTTTDRPAIIFAGYEREMARVGKCNPGMARRITHKFVFPDYSVEELVEIMIKMAEGDNFIVVAKRAELVQMVEEHINLELLSMHNAGFSSRLYLEAKECANARLAEFILVAEEIDVGNRTLRSILVVDFSTALENIVL